MYIIYIYIPYINEGIYDNNIHTRQLLTSASNPLAPNAFAALATAVISLWPSW